MVKANVRTNVPSVRSSDERVAKVTLDKIRFVFPLKEQKEYVGTHAKDFFPIPHHSRILKMSAFVSTSMLSCVRKCVTAARSLPVNTSNRLSFSLSIVVCPLHNIAFTKFLSVSSRLQFIRDKFQTAGTCAHRMPTVGCPEVLHINSKGN